MAEKIDLTAQLRQASNGDRDAESIVIAASFSELRKLAAFRLRRERPGHTLQPTALVNEAYLRLFGSAPIAWQSRAHFFAIASRQMRFILVDYARKRGSGPSLTVTLEGLMAEDSLRMSASFDENIVALHEALSEFERIDPRAARAVELRFFGGLTLKEVAYLQEVDVATVKRDWGFAKSWLYNHLYSPLSSQESGPNSG